MENRARDPIIVLKIEIRPEECSEMEKQLLRINGVQQVAINREKKKVAVIGDINPCMLVRQIAKMGRRAKLLLYDKKPKTDQANRAENHHKNAQASKDKHLNSGNQNAGQSGREKNFCCPDDHPHCKHRPAAKDVEEETFWERHSQFHSVQEDDKHRAAAKEFEEEMCRDQHGQFHSVHNDKYRAAPRKKFEEETFRDPYGQFDSVHNDKYHAATTGVEEEMCRDQYFHGGSRNTNGFVPPMNNEGSQHCSCPDHNPHCKMEDFTHHDKHHETQKMNPGRYGQFYGRSRSTKGFVPPRNTEDAKYYSFPSDHLHNAAAKGIEEEMSRGGYGHFHGRSRNANYGYVPPRYNEDICGNPNGHPHQTGDAFREAKIQEAIKEAKKDMDHFFSIRRRANDHFARGSSEYHHETPNPSRWFREEPPADDHYHDRNRPPPAFRERPMSDFELREEPPPFEQHHERIPPPPPRVYRGRPGIHYDKFTNLFSDENPSSCTIL